MSTPGLELASSIFVKGLKPKSPPGVTPVKSPLVPWVMPWPLPAPQSQGSFLTELL